MSISRRNVLGGLGGLVMGGALVGFMGGVAGAAEDKKGAVAAPTPAETKRFAQKGGDFSWKPHKLDLDEVTAVAHAGYHHNGYG